MAVIAGIRRVDGEPVESDLVAEILRRGHLGTEDRRDLWLGDGIGLGCRQFDTTPEARLEKQPEASPDGRCRIVFDGRLDNRPELLEELEVAPERAAQTTDPQLVLSAYRKWGADCPAQMVGDFAFALWDEAEQRLICGRDAVGIRWFFYHFDGRRLLFASQIEQLLAVPGLASSLELDMEFIADYLVSSGSSNDRTPFQGIRKLPPAHVMVVESAQVRISRYWDPPREKLRYSRDEDYAEHFLQLFRQAVARNLRSYGPVWSDLSGGLDSPAVVATAAQLLRQGEVPETPFTTLTIVFDEARESDEREWAQLVVDHYGLDNHHLPGDDCHAFKDVLEGAHYWDEPHTQIGSYAVCRKYIEMLSEDGARILLSGMGAEEVLTNDAPEPLHLADLLRAGRLAELRQQLVVWQRHLQVPMLNIFFHHCLRPILQPQRNYYLSQVNRGIPPWVDRTFADRWGLEERINRPLMARRYESAADQWQYERISRMPPGLAPGLLGKTFELRHPFTYRPLLDFGLMVPWEHKVSPGNRKPILRQAMKGILPEALRQRQEKIGAEHSVYLAIAKEWDQLAPLVRSSRLAELGAVDPQRFYHALQMARHGHAQQLAALGWTLTLEIWLRAFVKA